MKFFVLFSSILLVSLGHPQGWNASPPGWGWNGGPPAEGLVESAGQTISISGLDAAGGASDEVSLSVEAPEGQSANLSLDTHINPQLDIEFENYDLTLTGLAGEAVNSSGVYTDLGYGSAESNMTATLTDVAGGTIETKPEAVQATSIGQLLQSNWGQIASGVNLAGGWGSGWKKE